MRALYLSHTGMTEPLGQSQVLPYLRGLAQAGWTLELVSFEPPHASPAALAALKEELAAAHIHFSWATRSPSHTVRTKLTESLVGFVRVAEAALRRQPRIVHARSYLPGAVALAVASISPGSRFVFDCRGLLGDEYADAGHWSRESLRYRLVKRAERPLFRRADSVIVLTERLRTWLVDEAGYLASGDRVEVIPCCVDLARFRPDPVAREEARRRLSAGDRLVVAYSGTLGSWYCEEEIARFFAEVRRHREALLAVFTRSPTERLRRALRASGVADGDVHIESVDPSDMPARLSGADAAISFIRPVFSKIASSPVKLAEYLALGLPTVVNRGIGDVGALIASTGAVVDAGQLSDAELARAAERLVSLPPEAAAEARRLAEARFSLDEAVARYRRVYERLAS